MRLATSGDSLRTSCVALAFASVIVSQNAVACSCVRLPLDERFRQSHAVFVGEIVSHESLQFIQLKVVERFKGSASSLITFPVGRSDCDYFLPSVQAHTGDRFLVFLTRHEGEPNASRCMGSNPESASLEELTLLRAKRGR